MQPQLLLSAVYQYDIVIDNREAQLKAGRRGQLLCPAAAAAIRFMSVIIEEHVFSFDRDHLSLLFTTYDAADRKVIVNEHGLDSKPLPHSASDRTRAHGPSQDGIGRVCDITDLAEIGVDDHDGLVVVLVVRLPDTLQLRADLKRRDPGIMLHASYSNIRSMIFAHASILCRHIV